MPARGIRHERGADYGRNARSATDAQTGAFVIRRIAPTSPSCGPEPREWKFLEAVVARRTVILARVPSGSDQIGVDVAGPKAKGRDIMPPSLSVDIRHLLERPNFAHLATVMVDGSPRCFRISTRARTGSGAMSRASASMRARIRAREMDGGVGRSACHVASSTRRPWRALSIVASSSTPESPWVTHRTDRPRRPIRAPTRRTARTGASTSTRSRTALRPLLNHVRAGRCIGETARSL